MNQSSRSTTDLQLHHNFRWVLCANHMEPVQGFLARYLCRRLLDARVRDDAELTEMDGIVQWLPQVWQHVNRLLETHGGSDVTLGQQQHFLSCLAKIILNEVFLLTMQYHIDMGVHVPTQPQP